MPKFLLLAALAPLALAAQPAAKVDLPKPYHTPSANNRPQVVGRPEGAKITVPAGFTVEEFLSGGFERPRFMLAGPRGEILLSDTVNNGRVLALLDKNKDLKIGE
jgi:glucose/arabinose dehydrogenase